MQSVARKPKQATEPHQYQGYSVRWKRERGPINMQKPPRLVSVSG